MFVACGHDLRTTQVGGHGDGGLGIRRQLGARDVKLMSKAAYVYVHACVDVCAHASCMESRKRGWRQKRKSC